MDQLELYGGRPLKGDVWVSGSKNAALPCLFATLLTDAPCFLEHVPDLADINTAMRLLQTMGKIVERKDQKVWVFKGRKITGIAPYELVKKMRASAVVLGPLLARMGRAHVSLPGGCAIGARPINFHLEAFKKMGVDIQIKEGYVDANVKNLKGTDIRLPFPSVGATENVMMAAVLAQSKTVIKNAAKEPEIVDLGRMLNAMGANITGLGTNSVLIRGVEKLGGVVHRVIPDRIEGGTFLIAAAITRGDLKIFNIDLNHLEEVARCLERAGLRIQQENGFVRAKWVKNLKPVNITTKVYPGFPTDLQAQWIALMSLTSGNSIVKETVFENRFLHVQELVRMGANITLKDQKAFIHGVDRLSGCPVMVSDLRAGAALVLSGLAAKGKTIVWRVYHLDRGYEKFESKLKKLGARIKRVNPGRKKR